MDVGELRDALKDVPDNLTVRVYDDDSDHLFSDVSVEPDPEPGEFLLVVE